MPTINRREFVLGTAAGAAILAMPSFVEHAFAADRSDEDAARELAEANERAQRMHVPLLVWIVPRTDSSYERAVAYGAFLNHGPDEALADLALAEVVCAPTDVLRRLVPVLDESEPLMILVEGDSARPEIHLLDGQLVAPAPKGVRAATESGNESEARIDRYIATLSELIHRGIAESAAMVSARASIVADKATRAHVRRVAEKGSVSRKLAARAPAVVADVAREKGKPALVATLADLTRERLVRGRVPGSAWANHHGCSVDIEGEPPSPLDCGMGHVPERAERFLYFYTD